MNIETLADRLESQLLTINELSKVLVNNTAYKGSTERAQIDLIGEDAIQLAIGFISKMAHDDLCMILNSREAT